MEAKKSNPFLTILGGALSGMTIAFLATRRDMQVGEPSIIDKVKAFERKLYVKGQNHAHTLEKVKQDVEVAVATDNRDN